MKKEYKIYIGLGIIILLLLGFILIPKVTEGFKEKYRIEGYQICMAQVVNQIVNDLNTIGYTELRLNNTTIRLGVLQ